MVQRLHHQYKYRKRQTQGQKEVMTRSNFVYTVKIHTVKSPHTGIVAMPKKLRFHKLTWRKTKKKNVFNNHLTQQGELHSQLWRTKRRERTIGCDISATQK